MDVDEGFILGIYNYCDRWCDTCRFTSRCRVFADGAEDEAMASAEFRRMGEMAARSEDVREQPSWLGEMIEELNQAARDPLREPLSEPQPLSDQHHALITEARRYRDRTWQRLHARALTEPKDCDDPYSIILWFSGLIPAKVYRAVHGLADFDGNREFPPDHEGSAKVALIGIDRSMVAWSDAVVLGRLADSEAAELIGMLERLRSNLENAVPRARVFIRPGFDELDQVRRLEASDWS